MPVKPIRKNSSRITHRKKVSAQSCQACLFSPHECTTCAYRQYLIDILHHSLQIIKALPEKR